MLSFEDKGSNLVVDLLQDQDGLGMHTYEGLMGNRLPGQPKSTRGTEHSQIA